MKANWNRDSLPSDEDLFSKSKRPFYTVNLDEVATSKRIKRHIESGDVQLKVLKDLESETSERSNMYSKKYLFSPEVSRIYSMMTHRLLSMSSTATFSKNSDFPKFLVITVIGAYRDFNENFTHYLTSRDNGIKPLENVIKKWEPDTDSLVDKIMQIPGIGKKIEYDARFALVEFIEMCSTLFVDHDQSAALFEFFGKFKNMILDRMCCLVDVTLNYVALKYLDGNPMVERSSYDDLSQRLKQSEEKVANLSAENSSLRNQNSSLQDRIDSNKDITYLQDVNSDLSLAISRLETKHMDALAEIKRLRGIIKDLGVEELEESERITSQSEENVVSDEVVTNGNYVFVGVARGDRDYYINKLSERFPNAMFLDNQSDISCIDNCRLVVFFTKFLSHSYYYKVKKCCKSKKINFIHCNDWNVEVVANLIKSNLSFNI